MKKNLLTPIFTLFISSLFAQGITTLSGKIHGLDLESKIYLSQTAKPVRIDSLLVTRDSFQFKLNITEGDFYFITYYVKKQRFDYPVYLQKGANVSLKKTEQNPYISLSGSSLADEQNEFYSGIISITKNIDNQIAKETDSSKLQLLKDDKEIAFGDFCEKWVKTHNKSPFSVAVIFLFMQNSSLGVKNIENLYVSLDEQAKKNNRLTETIFGIFATMEASEIYKTGKKVEDFSLADTSGITHSFLNLKGESYVLLDFWASWCGPCRASTPELIKLAEKYGGEKFKIISISADTDIDQWKKAIISDRMFWKQLSDLKGTDNGFIKDHNVNSFPTYVLVAPNGQIIAKPVTIERVTSLVASIFK